MVIVVWCIKFWYHHSSSNTLFYISRVRRGRMLVGFTTICLSPLMWVRISIRARCTTLCDKVCQWLKTGRWFSPGAPISSTNKADQHDITEILLKHQNTNPNLFAYSRFDYIIMFFLLQNYFPLRRAKCHFMQSSIKIASILLKNLYSILML